MTERPVKQVIVIRRDLKMRRGKEIAQGAHAATAWLTRRMVFGDDRGSAPASASVTLSAAEMDWLAGSFRKVTVTVTSEEQLMAVYEKARAAGLVAELITDSGRTEFHGVPTPTSVGIGPDYDDLIDPVTGDLALY
jgi:peptidyl-tRNA hydrolase, PTH2 family